MTPPELDTHRSGSAQLKCYEVMMVKEMLGTSRPNEALQAVVENTLHESALGETNSSVLERNRALLQYVATLANSNSTTDEFNYEFVTSLISGGADINVADTYEQTIFHEVARVWNTDIAKFLLQNGCDINKRDSFGRTPLHVAAAVDFVEMVEFLLQNNADIDAKTLGEFQAPIHYAAKNGATRSLKMLLGFGANIDSLDSKGRTPLQLAAEWTRDKAAKVLIEEGASSCLLDRSGNSALCVLIDRLPNLAVEALNQLHTTDMITMKEFYFLQHLEASRQSVETKATRTPLETAVTAKTYEVVTHPVMQRLIHNKWVEFGRLSTIIDLLFQVVFGIAWTALCMGTPAEGKDLYGTYEARVWRIFLGVLVLLLTAYDIAWHIQLTIKARRSQKKWIEWRTSQLKHDLAYCHPRWPQEGKYVEYEINRVNSLPLFDAYDAWFYMEWMILLFIVATIASHFVYFDIDTHASRDVYIRTISIVNLLVWLRLLKYVRPIPGIGTLVIILGETTGDFINWAFLFFLLLIPFTASFWINFGGLSLNPVNGYDDTGEVLYSVFRMAIGDEFNLEEIVAADAVMARILVFLYVTAMSIVTLNLLIALLTDTFSRVYCNAVANTIMQRAIKIVEAERTLSKSRKAKHRDHMKLNCNPEETVWKVGGSELRSPSATTEHEMVENLTLLKTVLDERFGTVYGKNKTSDFDSIAKNVKKLQSKQDDLANDLIQIMQLINMVSDKYNGHHEGKKSSVQKFVAQANEGEKSSVQKFVAQANEDESRKSFVLTLQDSALSFFSGLMNTRNKDDDAESSQRRGAHQPERSERGRRRTRRMERHDDENRTMLAGEHRRRRRKPRPERDDGSRQYRGDAQNSFSNQAYGSGDQLAWDTVSIDSTSI